MAPEVILSFGALVVAAAGFASNLWYNSKNNWRSEAEALRQQHRDCEQKLGALSVQFDHLEHRYLRVLEDAVKRGVCPQVVIHPPSSGDGH